MSRKWRFLRLTVLLSMTGLYLMAGSPVPDPDPLRYQTEIDAFIQWDRKNSTPGDAVLFVGSSSIRIWKTHDAFPGLPVINRGFGGAHISDMLYFYEHIIQKYDADVIVFYCGDNDVAGKKSVNRVVEDYKTIVQKILKDNPDVHLIYLPIKPSVSRWQFWEEMHQVNQIIRKYQASNEHLHYLDTASPLLNSEGRPDPELLLKDGLHLNDRGYEAWNRLLSALLKELE